MKKRACFLISMLFASLALAGNPDERISLELDFTKHFTTYDRSISIIDTSFSQKDKAGPLNLDLKLILPSKESLSLIFGFGYVYDKIKLDTDDTLFDIEDKRSGFYLNLGMKFYFSKMHCANPAVGGTDEDDRRTRYK